MFLMLNLLFPQNDNTLFFLLIWVHFSLQALRPFISYYTFGVEALKTLDEVFVPFTLETSQ